MIIAIDIDEVLSDTLNHVLEGYNESRNTSFKREDFINYHYEVILSNDKESPKDIWDNFIRTKGHEIKPIEGAVEAVKKLALKHDLLILTSRSGEYAEITKNWLLNNFNIPIRIIYTNNFFGESHTKKSDFCSDEGVDIVIEDQARHALDCADVCKVVYLLDSPWNQNETLPENVKRVYSWEEIIEHIEGL